ncbi:hypothetical protein NS274_08030 [Pseudomonas oryzihabitans]|nr:hypothetical protein NS274_08030 [Pseudomonas psychrotolerans]
MSLASRPLLELVTRFDGDDLGQTIVLEQQVQGLDQPCRVIAGAGDAEDDCGFVVRARLGLLYRHQGLYIERMAYAADQELI